MVVKPLLIGLAVLVLGCKPEPSAKPAVADSTKQPPKFILSGSATIEDFTVPDDHFYAGKINMVREQFKRINATTKWTRVFSKDLQSSTEGGEATFYYHDTNIEKIAARYYGETGQALVEYYLLDGKLSFVFEKSYSYNRPIYWDSTAMKEAGDDQVFEFDSSEIVETRNYFDHGVLFHQIHNQDCGAPWANEYLRAETARFEKKYEELVILANDIE